MRRTILFLIIAVLVIFTACAEEEQTPTLTPPTLLSPADGAIITQNPPTFVWSTVNEDQIAYRLDVARDSVFTDTCICILISIWPPDTQYISDTAFAPGMYYWHMCTREDC
ncbi:MAG TPA: hypothetical protein VF399_04215 [bacterium]